MRALPATRSTPARTRLSRIPTCLKAAADRRLLGVVAALAALICTAAVSAVAAPAAAGVAGGRVDPPTAPLVLRPGLTLFEQFGYAPPYTRNVPGFDSRDRPYIRSRGADLHRTSFVHVLGDGGWERRGMLAAVRAAYPTFKDTRYAAGRFGARIIFDTQDRAYTIFKIELADGSLRNVLLASTDRCRSWQVVELPPGGVAAEHFVGHNRMDGPPFLGFFTGRAVHPSQQTNVWTFAVCQPRWEGDRVVVPAPVTVSTRCFGFGQHSGASSFAVTHYSEAAGRPLTHFVWGEVTASSTDPGSRIYAATYDPQSGTVGDVTLLGFASVRNDMHCAPGICVDSRGHLHVVFGAHHSPMRYTVSLQPDSVLGGWSPPVDVLASGYWTVGSDADGVARQTYASLVCDDRDNLHLVFRQYRRGVDGYHSGGGYMALAYQRRPAPAAGQPVTASEWEPPRLLVVPAAVGYTLYYQALAVDHGGRLFLSASNMSGAEWVRQRALVRIWRLRGRRGPRPGYYLHRFLLMSDDHGLSWRLATSADLAAGVDAEPAGEPDGPGGQGGEAGGGAAASDDGGAGSSAEVPYGGRLSSTGDGSWLWLNRRPQGNAIGGLDVFGRRRGIAVGDAGTVLTTTDGGRRWRVRRSPTASTLFAVDMASGKLAWAVGDLGTVLRTADGGRTWARQATPTVQPLFGVSFVCPRRGWAVGEGGVILATTDGGRSWRRQTSKTSDTLFAVHAVDETVAWIVGDNGLVLRTADGGRHWDRLRPRTADGEDDESRSGRTLPRLRRPLRVADVRRPRLAGSSGRAARLPALYSVYFVSRSRGWAVGDAGTILTTRDGGRTWRPQSGGVTRSLSSVRFATARVGWVVGQAGTVLSTGDGGAHWERRTKVRLDLYAAAVGGADASWVGGKAGMLAQVGRRGGLRRVVSSGAAVDLRGVAFADDLRGVAVGAAGTVLRTADGGSSWAAAAVPSTGTLHAVQQSGRTTVAVGDDGAIARSTDGGVTWARQQSPTDRSLRAVALPDAGHGWAVGDGGTVLRTSDGGQSWTPVPLGLGEGAAADLCAVAFPSAAAGYLGGGDRRGEADAVVLLTTDGGSTWTPRVVAPNGTVTSLCFASELVGWAAGYDMGPDEDGPRGFVARTTDGGLTWSLAYPPAAGRLRSLTRTAAGTLLLCGDGGGMWRSTDGGVSWVPLRCGAAADLHAVAAVAGSAYAVGDGGAVLKSTSVP